MSQLRLSNAKFGTLITALAIAMAPIWSVVAEAPTGPKLPAYSSFITREYATLNPEAPAPTPVKGQKPEKPKNIRLDASTLRTRLLESNLSIAVEYNQLQQAKVNVNLNRDKLFPSLNLTFGASFIVKAVSFLLPFLLPSNWFNLKQSKYLLESEKKSYSLMEYNMYASAYSLLVATIGDHRVLLAAADIADNYAHIQRIVQARHDAGLVLDEDLNVAKAAAFNASLAKNNMETKLQQDVAGLRQLLALDLDQNMEFVEEEVPASPDESLALSNALTKALDKSLEFKQMDDLIGAAKEGKMAAAWSWLGGVSLASNNSAGGGSVFSGLKPVGQIGLGLDLFDTIKLADLNEKQVGLRKDEVFQEQKTLIETTIPTVNIMIDGLANGEGAETYQKKAYEGYLNLYQSGLGETKTLVDSATAWSNNRISRIQAQTNLNLNRISLHRIMLSDQFERIPGCNNNNMGKKKQATLEDLCAPPSKQ